MSTIINKDDQNIHIAYFIQILEEFLLDWWIANPEIKTNMKSNELYQRGEVLQQEVEQDVTKNIKGVAIQ